LAELYERKDLGTDGRDRGPRPHPQQPKNLEKWLLVPCDQGQVEKMIVCGDVAGLIKWEEAFSKKAVMGYHGQPL